MRKFIFFFAVFLMAYFIMIAYNQADFDLWHRLAAGKLLFSTGKVPKADIFAYTHIKSLWIDHEWGSGAVFYFIYKYFGEQGLCILKLILLLCLFYPIYAMNRLQSEQNKENGIIFYCVFFYAILFGFLYTIRSQCFTYVFFALWLYILELVKRGNNKLLWIFPFTVIIWANLHGGFLAGLGILFLYGVGSLIKREAFGKYFGFFFLSTVVTLINPYGIDYWKFLYSAVTLKRTYITEWKSLDLFGDVIEALGFKVFVIITIFIIPYLIIKYNTKLQSSRHLTETQVSEAGASKCYDRQKNNSLLSLPIPEILILLTTFFLSLQHIRHNVFFVITASVYTAPYFKQAWSFYTNTKLQSSRHLTETQVSEAGASKDYDKRFSGKTERLAITAESNTLKAHSYKMSLKSCLLCRNRGGSNTKKFQSLFSFKILNYLVYAIIFTVGILTIHFIPIKMKVENSRYPVKAVEFIQKNKISGNLLVLFNWGGYALWKLYPQCLVAMDGRYEEVYPDSTVNESANFHYVIGHWREFMLKYPPDLMLLDITYPVYNEILKLKEWKQVYKDETAAVFIPNNILMFH